MTLADWLHITATVLFGVAASFNIATVRLLRRTRRRQTRTERKLQRGIDLEAADQLAFPRKVNREQEATETKG